VRGDIYEVKAPRGAKSHEQRGNRYAVVVQSDLLPLSTWLVAPTSAGARPTSFRPEVEIAGKTTLVLVEQTAAVDPQRLGHLIGHLTQRETTAINEALKAVLDLP
jgi:mRNA interferase MazF